MTSIVTVHPVRNIYEQVKWKMKASSSLFSTIIFVHILLGFLTSDGTNSYSSGGTIIRLDVKTYTLDGVFLYSTALMLILGWMLASNALSRDQQSIVTNNQTEVLATFLFSIILSVFTFLSGFFMLCITVALEMLKTNEALLIEKAFISPGTALLFIVIMLLAATIGYFIRAVFQFSKIVLVVVAAFLFLLIRAYGIETWNVVFGSENVEIMLRSVLYVFVLWGVTLYLRQFREVSRA